VGGAWLADFTSDALPYSVVAVLAVVTLGALARRRPRARAGVADRALSPGRRS